LRTYSVIGIRAPLHCTSVGKAILAFQDEGEIRRIARERKAGRELVIVVSAMAILLMICWS